MNDGPNGQFFSSYCRDFKHQVSFNYDIHEIYLHLVFQIEKAEKRVFFFDKVAEILDEKYFDIFLSKQIFWTVGKFLDSFWGEANSNFQHDFSQTQKSNDEIAEGSLG